MQWIQVLLILSVIQVGLIFGHKEGAPISACWSLTPNHGDVRPQNTSPPYIVTVMSLRGNEGFVNVTLRSDSAGLIPFTGLLLRVKDSSTGGGIRVTSGTFTIESGNLVILNCVDEKTTAVTHSSNILKYSENVIWQAPAGYDGEVVFLITFVRNFSTFWTPIQTTPVLVKRKSQIIESADESDDPSLSVTIQRMYEGCRSTKNCLHTLTPDNCFSTKNCNGLLTISPTRNDESSFQIEMYGKQTMFIAVGFSNDQQMGGDSVVECVFEKNTVNVFRSWNIPGRRSNTRLVDKSGINLLYGLYENNTIYCKIQISAVITMFNTTFDLSKNSYYVSLVGGKDLAENRPGVGFHDVFFVSSAGRYFLPIISDPDDESFYNNCGTEMVCYGYPDGCLPTKNCRFVTKVKGQNEKFIVSMLAKRAAYIATGFTEDQKRGNDHIVECLNNGSSVQTYRSWNVPQSFDNYRMGTAGVELLDGTVTSDGLICTVAFDPSVIPSFKLDQKYFLILVAGSSLKYQQVGYHNLVKRINQETVSMVKEGADGSDLFYKGCEQTKSCFGVPDNCVLSKNCDAVVAMANDNVGNRYSFHMLSSKVPDLGYIAFGLSDDRIMGEDAVIECVPEEKSVRTYMSSNSVTNKTNKRIKSTAMTHLHGSYVDGKLECIVLFQNSNFTFENRSYDLIKDKYVLMLAMGKTAFPSSDISIGSIGYHDISYTTSTEARPLHVLSSSAIRIATKLPLHLHGVLMIFAWIGFSSIGLIVARFYKNAPQSLFGAKWFTWHQYCAYLASALTTVGVTIICLYIGEVNIRPRLNHSFLGFIVAGLTILQPVTAFFRPTPKSPRRVFFNIIHWFVGNTLHILSVVVVFFSVHLKKSGLPNCTYWVLAGYIVHYIMVFLTLMTIENVHLSNANEAVENCNGVEKYGENLTKNSSQLKSRLFKLHVAVTILCVFSLSYIIIYGRR